MKKLIIGAAIAAMGLGAFATDALTSANCVGYMTRTVASDQFYLVGVQFEGVGEENVANLNELVKTSGITPVLYENTGNAARIDVLTADASAYDSYYYISDADDGSERYDLVGWADADGFIVDTATLDLGQGFWFIVPAASASGEVALTMAGQVVNASTYSLPVPAGKFAILSNPFPCALNLSKVQTTGLTPVLYENTGNAARIDVLTADASAYDSYYYISDADDGTERYDLTGWADADGFIIDSNVIEIGTSFWVTSPNAGLLSFSL